MLAFERHYFTNYVKIKKNEIYNEDMLEDEVVINGVMVDITTYRKTNKEVTSDKLSKT